MKIWLPESVYRKVKDDESYKLAVEQLESYIGHSSDATSYFGDDIPEDVYQNFSETVKHICGDGYEKLLFETQEILTASDFQIDSLKLRDIGKKIDSLPESDEKIICQIYWYQLSCLTFLQSDGSFHNQSLLERRKTILKLFSSSETKNYDEETFATYIFQSFDLFFAEFQDYKGEKNYDFVTAKIKEFFQFTQKIYSETSNKFQSDYYRNMIGYNKLCNVHDLYNHLFEFCDIDKIEFKEIDKELQDYLSSISFKYKSGDYYTLMIDFIRLKKFNDYSLIEDMISLYNSLSKKIKFLLDDKINFMESLNYMANSYHKHFLFFIEGMKKFESDIMEGLPEKFPNLNIKITGKFSDITLTEKEQNYLEHAPEEERQRLQLNLESFKTKIYG